MKRLIVILVILILFGTIAASASSIDTQAFDLALTKQFKKYGYNTTAAAIMEDESSRSSVTCTLLIDLVSANKSDFTSDNFADCLLTSSNIFTNGEYVGISGFFDHKVVHIAYDPVTDSVSYSIDDAGVGSDEFNCIYDKQVMESKGFTVYTNESEEMQRVFYILMGEN